MDFLSTYSSLNENRLLLGLPQFSFKQYLSALTLRSPQDRLLCAIITHFLLEKLNTRTTFLNSCNYALEWYQNPTSRCKKLAFLSNFKDFTDLSLSGRNQLFTALATTIYSDVAQKVQENGQISSKGADIDTFFELGLDMDGNEWYLFYPDFLVCVGENLGGKDFVQLFDESHAESDELLQWMKESDYFVYVSTSAGLPISIEENLATTRDSFTYMQLENLFYQELEPDSGDVSKELNFLEFHKKFLPSEKFIKLLETHSHKEIIDILAGSDGIKDMFFEKDGDALVNNESSSSSEIAPEQESVNVFEVEELSHEASEENSSGSSQSVSEDNEDYIVNPSVSAKEESVEQDSIEISDELRRYRIAEQEHTYNAFCEYQKKEVIDCSAIEKAYERISFLEKTRLSLFELIEPSVVQFSSIIQQKSLEKHNIARDMPISIIRINGNHRFLNELINDIEFKAISIVLHTLENAIPLETFARSKAELSGKNFNSYKQMLVGFLDDAYSIGAGFSEYYHDYMHEHNIFLEELENVASNFLDDISAEGPYGEWEIKAIIPNADGFTLKVYCKERELSRLAEHYTNIVSSMPDFLKNKLYVPRSVELQALRVYLGYEALPLPRAPTPPLEPSSHSSNADTGKERNERRGYDFSDSESYSSYDLSSTSSTSPYSDPESSETEYVEYWVYPGNEFTPMHVVYPPFEEVECVASPEDGDPSRPFLVRQPRKDYNRVMRQRRETRKSRGENIIKRDPSEQRPGRHASINPADIGQYRALRELREKQRLEMEMYQRRLRSNLKPSEIPYFHNNANKIPDISPLAKEKTIPQVSLGRIPILRPISKMETTSAEPTSATERQDQNALSMPADLIIPNLNFDFDFE